MGYRMKKILMLITLLNIGTTFTCHAANLKNINNNEPKVEQFIYGKNLIPIGEIEASITDSIKLKPDTVEFTVTLDTDASTPSEASNINANTMKQFKDYLATLAIKDNNLITTDYGNYIQDSYEEVSEDNAQYKATLTLAININDNEKFLELNKLLDKYNINNVQQLYNSETNNAFSFSIFENAVTANKAKDMVYQKYTTITNELKNLQLDNFSIIQSNTERTSPKKIDKKQHHVYNTVQIKINKLDVVSKIITKAQELKIKVNDDIFYSVSPDAIERAINDHERLLLNKLINKVERLLTKQYLVGDPKYLDMRKADYEQQSPKRRERFYGAMNMAMAPGSDDNATNKINIYAPSDFEIQLTLLGRFEIIKKVTQ
ncbi:hypothetical protein B6D22_08050 [Gilliamella apicola]|nr:hypothetical protein B6D22_08050 [Gilliamella apicola]